MKTVNFNLKHPSQGLWKAQMCFPVYFPRDIFSRTTNTLISLLAKLILARSPLGLRAKIVILGLAVKEFGV